MRRAPDDSKADNLFAHDEDDVDAMTATGLTTSAHSLREFHPPVER